MAIEKPRNQRRRGRRNNRRNRDHHQRTEAEQLDYEMELMRARREGREEDFRRDEREKMRVRAAARLDEEMNEYFAAKKATDDEEDPSKNAPNASASDSKPNDSDSVPLNADANSKEMSVEPATGTADVPPSVTDTAAVASN